MLVSGEELELDTIIKRDSNGLSVAIPDSVDRPEITQIETTLVGRPETIRSKANTRYQTVDSVYVIRFLRESRAKRI